MFNRRGQNVAEYSILIALVVGAAVAMQVYVKRGLQGRVKDAVDYTGTGSGNTTVTFSGKQYEPYYLNSSMTVDSSRSYQDTVSAKGGLGRTGIVETTTRATGSFEKTLGTSHRNDTTSN